MHVLSLMRLDIFLRRISPDEKFLFQIPFHSALTFPPLILFIVYMLYYFSVISIIYSNSQISIAVHNGST